MLSAMFIMDSKGKVIISRNYRGDVPMTVNERFATYISEKEELEHRPVFTDEGYTFVYIKARDTAAAASCACARAREGREGENEIAAVVARLGSHSFCARVWPRSSVPSRSTTTCT